MSAQIIWITRPENVEALAPICPPHQRSFRASLTGALRRYWRRTRLTVEAFGWIVLLASIIAALKGSG